MYRTMRGDTIVEVLIAIVVLGSALGGAFAISNKSTLSTQANHERYQAQLLLNQEAEKIRTEYENKLKDGKNRDDLYNEYCSMSCTQSVGDYSIKTEQITPSSSSLLDKYYDITVTWPQLGGGEGRMELRYGV